MVEGLNEFVSGRLLFIAKVACCLVSEVIVFAIWLLLASLADWLAHLAQSYGVNEWVALAFRAFSSITTFFLTVLWGANDVRSEYRKLFGPPATEPKESSKQA